jgi:hypothetical protein
MENSFCVTDKISSVSQKMAGAVPAISVANNRLEGVALTCSAQRGKLSPKAPVSL